MAAPDVGDTVIIRRDRQVFDVLDVASNEVLASRDTFIEALIVAAQCVGMVWQQPMDREGRYFGEPIAVLHRDASP